MKSLNRKEFIGLGAVGLLSLWQPKKSFAGSLELAANKRIGIIGLDTSHSVAFTKSINEDSAAYRDYKVVAAYPYGTKTIPSATERIPKYIEEIQKYGVEVVDSIDKLLKNVDAVLLETNDGRLHLEQAEKVFKAKKTLFIDKPLAASYADATAIFELSKKYNVPFFSTSSLRYISGLDEVVAGKYGKVLGADIYTTAVIDPSHPDFFWYGIHGVEILFTALGIGCESVTRTHTADTDTIAGLWDDGRIGTVRGIRKGKAGFGGTIFCEQGIVQLGDFKGYTPLLHEIVEFFDTKKVPFNPVETLEICAFIDAADISKANNGNRIELKSLIK